MNELIDFSNTNFFARIIKKLNLSDFANRIKSFFVKHKHGWITFGILMLISYSIAIYTYITNKFIITLGGDYNSQSMTFNFLTYDLWHEFFRTGHFPLFDNHSFLGLDNLGANSFYFMFDPWYIILLPFPRSWQMVLQSLMFPMKGVFGGICTYFLLKEFKLKYSTCTLFSIAYAFCGYTMMYYWFQFPDSVCFLPLIILGIEKVIKYKDPRILLISYFLVGLANFFIFANFLLGGFIYAMFRFFQRCKKNNKDENIQVLAIGFIGFLIPILATSFILIPGVFNAKNMPRANNTSYLDKLLAAEGLLEKLKVFFSFDVPSQQTNMLSGFLFMPLGCFYQNIGNVPYFDNIGQNSFISTPLTLITFFSIIVGLKSKKPSYYVGIIGVFFMWITPFCYYLFSGFTVGYSRFLIILVMFEIIFDAITFDKIKEYKRLNLDFAFILYIIFVLVDVFLLLTDFKVNTDKHEKAWEYKLRFVLIPLEVIYAIVSYVTMRILYFKHGKFIKATTLLTCIELCIAGNLTMIIQGSFSVDTRGGGLTNIKEETTIASLMNDNDNTYFRVGSSTETKNDTGIGLTFGFNTASLFNSSYPFLAQDFLNASHIPYSYKNWSMGFHERRPVLNTLLNMKYYLVEDEDKNMPYGYKEYKDLNSEDLSYLQMTYSQKLADKLVEYNRKLYVDTNYINLLFPYDYIFNYDNFMYHYYTEFENESYYLSALGIYGDDLNTFSKLDRYEDLSKDKKKEITLSTTNFSYIPSSFFYLFRPTFVDGHDNICAEDDYYCRDYYIHQGVDNKGNNFNQSTTSYYLSKFGIDKTYVYVPTSRAGYQDYLKTNLYKRTKVLIDLNGNPLCKDMDDGCLVNIHTQNNYKVHFYGKDAYDYNPKDVGRIKNLPVKERIKPFEPITSGYHVNSSYKEIRSFYLNEPAYYIVLELNSYEDNTAIPGFSYTSFDVLENQLSRLKESQKDMSIVSRTSDKIVFRTNYDTTKAVLINIPYYEGFTLTKTFITETGEGSDYKKVVKTKDIELFNTQGGFLGYLDEPTSSSYTDSYYTLEYKPKYFTITKYASLLGFTSIIALVIYYMYEDNKRKFKQEHFGTLKYQSEKYFDEMNKLD